MERARHWTGRSYPLKEPVARTYQQPAYHNPHVDWLVGALNAVDAVVYAIDRSYRITLVNEGWARFARANGSTLTSDVVIGHNVLSAIHGPQRDELQRLCEAIFAGRLPSHEYDIDCSSPTEQRIFHMTITPIRHPAGEIVGATFTSRDITQERLLAAEVARQRRELEQARTALRRRVERTARLQRLLSDMSEHLSSLLNQQAIVEYVTDALVAQLDMAFARVWLWESEQNELVLRSSAGLYTGTDGRYSRLQLGECTVGEIAQRRTAFTTNDAASVDGIGDPTWTAAMGIRAFAGYPLLAHDRLLGVVAFFDREPLDDEIVVLLEPLVHQIGLALERARLYVAEVEARQEAQALAHVAATRAAQLDAMLSAMTEGVIACDCDGTLLMINKAAQTQLGVSDAAMLSTIDDLHALLTADQDPVRTLGLRNALAHAPVNTTCEIQRVADNAFLNITVAARPIMDMRGDVCGAVAVVRDVTHQQALDRLKEDFLSIAAHELKTPVTAIKGYAQLALTRLRSNSDPARLQRALVTINEQSERIAHLVQTLLDVSRIQADRLDLHPRPCDLVGLVRGVIERVSNGSCLHCIELDAPPSVPVHVDYARIDQVVQNLIDNAAKYSPPDSPISVLIAVRDGMARVLIRDQGVGIPQDKQARIFEPWFQAHSETVGDFGGMGLGLSICKAIVDQHGGHVWFTSNAGSGSEFCFDLPLHPSPNAEDDTIAT